MAASPSVPRLRVRCLGLWLDCGVSLGQLGNVFGTGFSEKIYSPGLVIVGAALWPGFAETRPLPIGSWRRRSLAIRLGSNGIAAFLGLIAGIGASPATALALLTPLIPPSAARSRKSESSPDRAGARDFREPRSGIVFTGRSRPCPSSTPHGAASLCSACRWQSCRCLRRDLVTLAAMAR